MSPRSRSRRRSVANGGSASTATGTIATDKTYVGRFAPSPTGALHLGSLVAALGSYLDARHHGGSWLLRIEDLDTPRVIPGCADQMLRTLEQFGLHWDGPVEYQSRNQDRYLEALRALEAAGRTFRCVCSRRVLAESDDRGYPGTCRERGIRDPNSAIRFRVDDVRVAFQDEYQGPCEFAMGSLGDVVIRRRDGIFAYQLAVVVDDAHQGITHVVRGADLLESTPWQIQLQKALKLATPHYAHLPLIVEPDGAKLAKSLRSLPLAPELAASQLMQALALLQQNPAPQLAAARPAEIVEIAIARWHPAAFHRVTTLRAVK